MQATAALAPQRGVLSAGPLLRLRSDEQLVRLFRAGNEDAFRVIHDRYRTRLFAYARQMLGGSRQDAEDALQDVFVRAYGALRASDRDVSLRAWLYRVAHNRCIDELRRPAPPPPEAFELIRPPANDPMAETEQRESLRRLVADVQRLPEQQRSALLMRELSGMAYDDLAVALDVTVPAIKSLLVRARIGLAQAAEARDTACVEIREALADSHERGVRATGLARRHLQDCDGCRAYRGELRATHKRFAALLPALGPGALLAQLLGIGGGGAAGGAGVSAASGGGAAAAGVVAGGSATAGGVLAGAGVGAAIGGGAAGVSATHVVAVVAAAVVSAGGAVEVQRTLHAHHQRQAPSAAVVRQAHAPSAASLAPPAVVIPADNATAGARGKALRLKIVKQVAAVAPAAPVAGAVVDAPRNGGAGLPADLVTEPAPAAPAVPDDETTPAAPPTDPATSADGDTASTTGSGTPAGGSGSGSTGSPSGNTTPSSGSASGPGGATIAGASTTAP